MGGLTTGADRALTHTLQLKPRQAAASMLREEQKRTWHLINLVTSGDSRSEGQSYVVTYFLHYQMHKLMRIKTFVISDVHSS